MSADTAAVDQVGWLLRRLPSVHPFQPEVTSCHTNDDAVEVAIVFFEAKPRGHTTAVHRRRFSFWHARCCMAMTSTASLYSYRTGRCPSSFRFENSYNALLLFRATRVALLSLVFLSHTPVNKQYTNFCW